MSQNSRLPKLILKYFECQNMFKSDLILSKNIQVTIPPLFLCTHRLVEYNGNDQFNVYIYRIEWITCQQRKLCGIFEYKAFHKNDLSLSPSLSLIIYTWTAIHCNVNNIFSLFSNFINISLITYTQFSSYIISISKPILDMSEMIIVYYLHLRWYVFCWLECIYQNCAFLSLYTIYYAYIMLA